MSSDSDFVIRMKEVNFAYPSITGKLGSLILSGINLEMRPGQLVALMGGSGSGKTTILRLLGGQVVPQSGEITVAGYNVCDISRKEMYQMRKKLGMLFQFGALFTDMNVYDNVAFPLREHTELPESAIRDIVLLKLDAVGLRGARNLYPAELSGGMARRVALARTIALDPQIILYDEPFTGLDPISLSQIARLIRILSISLGAAAVIVTHDIEQSLAIVDYVYFLDKGKIAAQGTPQEIRDTDDAYVRQFIKGQIDGPVAFHYPCPEYAMDLSLNPSNVDLDMTVRLRSLDR